MGNLLDRKKSIIFLEILFLFAFFRSDGILKYIVFLLVIVARIARHQVKMERKLCVIIFPSLFCVIYGSLLALMNQTFTIESFKECIFIILPVIGSCIFIDTKKKKNNEIYTDIVFDVIVILFIVFDVPRFTIRDLAESTYAFTFGLFTLYYFYRKQKKRLFAAVICSILAGKRIVWGAVIFGIMAMTVMTKRDHSKCAFYKKAIKVMRCIGIMGVISLLTYVYMCKTGIINETMNRLGLNSMGRLNVWHVFTAYYEFSPFFVGAGLGSVKESLIKYNNAYFARLHNDILVYYIELGFLGFVLAFYSCFEVVVYYIKQGLVTYRKALFLIALISYTLICCCTDNVSIYINYMFPMYLIVEGCIYDKDSIFKNHTNKREMRKVKWEEETRC